MSTWILEENMRFYVGGIRFFESDIFSFHFYNSV